MSGPRKCPDCGEDLRVYSLEGAIRESVASEAPNEWALNGDQLDTDYEACSDAEHAYCNHCGSSFNARNGKKYVEDPMVCIRRAVEHVMEALDKDMIPLPLRSGNPQQLAAAASADANRAIRLEDNDPNILP